MYLKKYWKFIAIIFTHVYKVIARVARYYFRRETHTRGEFAINGKIFSFFFAFGALNVLAIVCATHTHSIVVQHLCVALAFRSEIVARIIVAGASHEQGKMFQVPHAAARACKYIALCFCNITQRDNSLFGPRRHHHVHVTHIIPRSAAQREFSPCRVCFLTNTVYTRERERPVVHTRCPYSLFVLLRVTSDRWLQNVSDVSMNYLRKRFLLESLPHCC